MSVSWSNSDRTAGRMRFLFIIVGMVFVMCLGGLLTSFLLYKKLRTNASPNGQWIGPLYYPNCPRCYTPVPHARAPNSLRQTLLGGWTCTSCECEISRYGYER